jgi:Domain of unknown function (DUF3560)
MTRRERMERRAEQRDMWADSAKVAATRRFDAADSAVAGIEPGQLILVGHHSEKRHRAALDRCDSNMRAGFERQNMATRHAEVADTLHARLETTIFSDDADATSELESRIAEREAERARIVELNKGLRRELKTGGGKLTPGAFERLACTPKEIASVESNARYSGQITFPAYTLSNLSGRIKADRDRLESIKRQNVRRQAAADAGGTFVQRFLDSNWCQITFAEKPERAILDALRAAGYGWGGGSWSGYLDKLPAGVTA